MCFHTFRYECEDDTYTVAVWGATPALAAADFSERSWVGQKFRTAFEFTARHVGTSRCAPRDWFVGREWW